MGFKSRDEIDQFVAKYGEAKLMAELHSGRHTGDSMKYLIEWQAEYEVYMRNVDADLRRRAVEAAETSAEAAGDSARFAYNSSRWAMFAVIAAVASLAISAYPLIFK